MTEHEDPAATIARLQANLADAERRVQLALTPDAKALLARKDSTIWGLRQELERAERAAGKVAAEKQAVWSDVAAALGVEAGLPDAPRRCLEAVRGYQEALARKSASGDTAAESSNGDTVPVTYDQAVEHMRKGGVVEINSAYLRGQRCMVDGSYRARETPTDDWGPAQFRDLNDAPGFYRLLPIDQSEAKP